jgi:hypothetical protein
LGVCDKRVFVTSSFHDGNLGGLAGADAICQLDAMAAGLGGTYMAWLSAADGWPASRFMQSIGRYVLVNGTVIADSWADLTDASLDNPLDRTETGAIATAPYVCFDAPAVWSGTYRNGTHATGDNCNDWTAAAGQHMLYYGDLGATDWGWGAGCFTNLNGNCALLLPIYCFEQ